MNDTVSNNDDDGYASALDVHNLLVHLFHNEFCVRDDISQEHKHMVLRSYFCNWLDAYMSELDPETACEQAHVPLAAWKRVDDIVSGTVGPETIEPSWYNIVLADRPPLQHQIKTVSMSVLITYQDGTMAPLQNFTTKEMLQGQDFSDALLASIISDVAKQLVKMVVSQGSDGLHNAASQIAFTSAEPEDPYEVMMGIILKYVIPKAKPTLQQPITNYMRLFQQLVRPVLAQQMKDKYAAKMQEMLTKQLAAFDAPDKNKPASGGWNA